ncbi:MAG: DUF2484 family protein [Alphaproteobacteria bacterium]|nr:DUF2484 family protein [Alphaproteobacteria bacterium]
MTGLQLLSLPVTVLGVTGGWLCLALLVPLMAARWRPFATGALVVAGVPAVGWLTLLWGPGIGVLGFALGVLALCGTTFRRRLPAARDLSKGQRT